MRFIAPALLAAAGAEVAHAREAVQLPLSCEVRAGRLLARPAPLTTYELATGREHRAVTMCTPGDPEGCRHVMAYRFDVICGNAQVPWVQLAASLANANGFRAVVRRNQMFMRRAGQPNIDECDIELGAEAEATRRERGFRDARSFARLPTQCRGETRAQSRAATIVMPRGFAPVSMLGARFGTLSPPTVEERSGNEQRRTAVLAPPQQPQQVLPQQSKPSVATSAVERPPEVPKPVLVAPAKSDADDVTTPEPATPAVAASAEHSPPGSVASGYGNPHIAASERWADPPPLRFPERPKAEKPVPETPAANTKVLPSTPLLWVEPVQQADLPPAEVVPAPQPVEQAQPEPASTEQPETGQAAVTPSRVPPRPGPLATAPVVTVPTESAPPASIVQATPEASLAAVAVPKSIMVSESHSELTEEEAKLLPVSGWSSIITPAEPKVSATFDIAPLRAFTVLTAQWRDFRPERDFTILLVGLTLLSGLISGAGWFATRVRRERGETSIMPYRVEPDVGRRSASPSSSSVMLRPSTMLTPQDERMCTELCKTSHTMLKQIESSVDSLNGVAPLRRVLQKEMRHLEQFLSAVMTAQPSEVEEWRRMRNRLQRIVKELHRLKEIVDGAQRSLSGAGFARREPPRDRYEAYELLGVNADVSPKTLKKLVDALRACWHPDLAKDEADRVVREERMKRINIAWDILAEKRQET